MFLDASAIWMASDKSPLIKWSSRPMWGLPPWVLHGTAADPKAMFRGSGHTPDCPCGLSNHQPTYHITRTETLKTAANKMLCDRWWCHTYSKYLLTPIKVALCSCEISPFYEKPFSLCGPIYFCCIFSCYSATAVLMSLLGVLRSLTRHRFPLRFQQLQTNLPYSNCKYVEKTSL